MNSFVTDASPINSTNKAPNQAPPQQEINDYQQEIGLSRKIEFDRGNPLSFNFRSNRVYTIPYSFKGYISFLYNKYLETPLNQCMTLVLFYYLIAFLCDIKEIKRLNLFYSISFHLTIFLLQFFKATFEYIKIYINDRKTNNQMCHKYSNEEHKFINLKWKDIMVGNIIRVNKDEVVPADILILEAMDHSHQCYVDYSSVNGNFDKFIVKKACNDSQSPTMKQIKFTDYVKNIKGFLKYEEPNSNMHCFNGRLKLESFPRASDIKDENFVMRGSTIKNVKFVYGLVVYTGMETKIMMTLKFTQSTDASKNYEEFKGGPINQRKNEQFTKAIIKNDTEFMRQALKKIQYILIILYVILVLLGLLVMLHGVCNLYYTFVKTEDKHVVDYLGYHDGDTKGNVFYELFLSSTTLILNIHFILPFDWFGLLEIAYIILSIFIKWDYHIKNSSKDQVEIIYNNSLANFGQVKHILTDKTGTLTMRKFQLKAVSILGKLFSFDTSEQSDENYIFKLEEDDLNELEIVKEMNSDSKFAPNIKTFLEHLCLCHNVKVSEEKIDENRIDSNKVWKIISSSTKSVFPKTLSLGSTYAEEKAMLSMLSKIGYKITKSKNNLIELNINDVKKKYDVLAINMYSKERNRMSVLIRIPGSYKSILICKANSLESISLIKKDTEEAKRLIDRTLIQIHDLGQYGYRYFLFMKKELNEDETIGFLNKYKSAENYVINSAMHLNSLALEYEKNLEFMGVCFFNEKIDDELKISISKLNNAGIKTWIASGDNKENVVAVARSLGLYNGKSIKGDFSDKDKPEDLDIKMSMLLMQFLFPNDKINKMKTRTGANVDMKTMKTSGTKELTILLSGGCFSRICNDQRNFQSLATLLSYCTNLMAYNFSANNKFVLCQMIKNYCSKNSKVLAVGDGFNDFTMLKEADLSVGIYSREILQVRNTCDIIVSKFSQIVDLILVHGTWSYHKIICIALLSGYASCIMVIPKFLYINENPVGSCFYEENHGIFTLNMLIVNLFIIFAFAFEYPIERSLITINYHVYKENFYDEETLFYRFGFELFRAYIDSIIIYFFVRTTAKTSINLVGHTEEDKTIGLFITYTAIFLILTKVYVLRLHSFNHIHIIIFILTICAIIGVIYLDTTYKYFVYQSLSFISLILNSINIIVLCIAYESIIKKLKKTFNQNFIVKLSTMFNNLIQNNMFLKNYQAMYSSLVKETPSRPSKLDKITYPEILEKIYNTNHSLDPALENMSDVSNDDVAKLKIRKPFLSFFDIKIELDYLEYNRGRLRIVHAVFLGIQLAFWIVTVIIEKFEGQIVSKIIRLIYIFFGLVLYLPKIWKKIFNASLIYFFIIFTIEIILAYSEKNNGNDTKICFQVSILLPHILFFHPNFKWAIIISSYYLILLTPAIYMNDFDIYDYPIDFKQRHLASFYQRHLLIWASGIVFAVTAFYKGLRSRVQFLKYHKSKVELKKDNLIMSNLIPEFVRAKLQRGERGAATYGYEVVSMIFCDIYDFDGLVSQLAPKEIISLLDEFYSILDKFCQLHGLQKIETVGKTYMAAGGIKECEINIAPLLLSSHHAVRCFEFSIDILDLVNKMILSTGNKLKVKIGIHLGKVIPAVVGNHKPQFSLIGDAVNVTSRMCSNSDINCVTCSEFAYEEIKQSYKNFTRITKEIKGKGPMNLYMYNPMKQKKDFFDKMRGPIARDSSGNLVIRSTTKKIPVLVKQKSKVSAARGDNSQSMLKSIDGNIRNEDSFRVSNKKSELEDSMLIVENSQELLVSGQNGNNVFNELNPTSDPYYLSSMNNFSNFNAFNPIQNDSRKKSSIPLSVAVEPVQTEQTQENSFLANSTFFTCFKDETAKNGFARFQKAELIGSEPRAVSLLLLLSLQLILGSLMMFQFSITGDKDIATFNAIKAICAVMVVCEVFLMNHLITNNQKIMPYIITSVFFIISAVNHIFINKIEEYNRINIFIEESLMLFIINAVGIFSYMETNFNFLLHILISVVDCIYNYNNFIMKKYNCYLIFICIMRIVYTVLVYCHMTYDFLINQKESKTLVNTEKMLFNLMPLHVVQNMKDDIPVADVLDSVTLLFADIVSYTNFGNSHQPVEVVQLLMELYKNFDDATKACHVYKVHTIGDCYVVMGFNGKVSMNERNYYEEAKNVCKMGEEMIRIIREVRKKVNFPSLDMRIGIHTGPVIAGIIGSSVVRYDIFGSDVLIANKMESSGVPGRINVSEDTKKLLETKDNIYSMTMNKIVQIPSVNKEIKCYLIDNGNIDGE